MGEQDEYTPPEQGDAAKQAVIDDFISRLGTPSVFTILEEAPENSQLELLNRMVRGLMDSLVSTEQGYEWTGIGQNMQLSLLIRMLSTVFAAEAQYETSGGRTPDEPFAVTAFSDGRVIGQATFLPTSEGRYKLAQREDDEKIMAVEGLYTKLGKIGHSLFVEQAAGESSRERLLRQRIQAQLSESVTVANGVTTWESDKLHTVFQFFAALAAIGATDIQVEQTPTTLSLINEEGTRIVFEKGRDGAYRLQE